MAKRPKAKEPSLSERCKALHVLSNQAITQIGTWTAQDAVTKELTRALQQVQAKAEEILEIGRTTGGFTAPQREALDHMADFVTCMNNNTDDSNEIAPTSQLLNQLWGILTKISCRLAPKAGS